MFSLNHIIGSKCYGAFMRIKKGKKSIKVFINRKIRTNHLYNSYIKLKWVTNLIH